MMLVDANLLIYAFSSSMPEHESSRQWLDSQFGGSQQVGLPWESLTAFARIVTNPRAFSTPASMQSAWDQVQSWLEHPSTWVPVPSQTHSSVMTEMMSTAGLTSRDVPDAHLAALAVSQGLKLATHDSGFARFPGLRWFDPLV